ncbi:hypothetical protein SAMN05444143_1362 [Flavobacterium succinicans]|uniref:Uncharacterized protein n=1 Tax=Flavobacterium succinicans TaxID=29536 RepID=A0A1I5ADH0_9FLAO|nr:hypothetical protein [Flavobacterium succinicans]SFN60463.1 hypothetical protein SAMN05444143_1362 [Flavobacterium succinicans]
MTTIFICLSFIIIIILFRHNFLLIKTLKNLKKIESKDNNDTIGIIVIILIIVFLIPYLFTRSVFKEYNFSDTGEIGDTIGGITSPFINGIAAILVYIAFKEQKKSNDILTEEINIEKNKELENLETLKKVILYDLNVRIKPGAERIIIEIRKCLEELEDTNIKYYNDHVDFNDQIFKSNNLSSYLKIFNKEPKDFNVILNIYNRVNFIYKHTPLQISFKYPTDKNNMVFIDVPKKRRTTTIERHLAKKKIELELLINNTKSLIDNIDEILLKYE